MICCCKDHNETESEVVLPLNDNKNDGMPTRTEKQPVKPMPKKQSGAKTEIQEEMRQWPNIKR